MVQAGIVETAEVRDVHRFDEAAPKHEHNECNDGNGRKFRIHAGSPLIVRPLYWRSRAALQPVGRIGTAFAPGAHLRLHKRPPRESGSKREKRNDSA